MFKKLITAPLSWIYGWIIALRHKLFDMQILKSVEFDIPTVCDGNITVGGTGKTPHTEYLVKMLSPYYNVAVLSRGYKRKTKGFVLADANCSSRKIGDEPKQIKLKFPDIPVAVCEKRVEGINRLRQIHPEINLIILDDGFQHRYVETWVNIILMDYSRPIYEDQLLPLGRLRDRKSELAKAHFIIVTKCPEDIKPIDMRVVSKHLNLFPYQSLFFTRFISLQPCPLFKEETPILPHKGQDVVVMAAIANPSHLIDDVKRNYNIVETLIYPDHYSYKTHDLEAMNKAVRKGKEDTIILTTEKDAVKLTNSKKIPENIRRRLYYIPNRIQFVDNFRNNTPELFIEKLLPYVRQNQKYSVLNPE